MSLAEGVILKIALNILLNDEQTAMQIFWATLSDSVGSGPLDEDDVIDAAANWMDEIYAHVSDALADTITPGLVEVWEVDGPTGDLTPIGDGAASWTATSVVDSLPNGCAIIGSLKTTNTDVTGRKFIPGWGDEGAVDNNLAAGPLGKLVNFVAEWATVFVDANEVQLNPGVYSNTLNNFYLTSGVAVANAIVGYQRRRKPGVGS